MRRSGQPWWRQTSKGFNSLLEMQVVITPVNRLWIKFLFQFSIGDAKDGERLVYQVYGGAESFNSLLEMLYLSTRTKAPWRGSTFQFSIGDATRFAVGAECGARHKVVSILYWRCSAAALSLTNAASAAGFNSLLEMQKQRRV